MPTEGLPTEVELIYEISPCAALRRAQAPGPKPHPCSYFVKWGRYHSYSYETDGPPPRPGIVQRSQYLGRGPMAPEALSGCRKAPIMTVGINPNLPGWWPATRNSISPLFDDYRQYAHYFRYRETAKLQIPMPAYQEFGGGPEDTPFSDHELSPPIEEHHERVIPVELQPVTMYENYQALLDDLAKAMGWRNHQLILGEDVSYGNMVACPSAKWINAPDPQNPAMPPMSPEEQIGIVAECFHHRAYFLRQLFQSLPSILMIFSQSTTDAFLGETHMHFVEGSPKPGDKIDDLINKELRLRLGKTQSGDALDVRVIFSPHITGDPAHFASARAKVLAQLVDEARKGGIALNPKTGHLSRPKGACVFCTMLRIGPCDYEKELQPLTGGAPLTTASPMAAHMAEKAIGERLVSHFIGATRSGRAKAEMSVGPMSEASLAKRDLSARAAAAQSDAAWTIAANPYRDISREPSPKERK